jgi:hypothetical protein
MRNIGRWAAINGFFYLIILAVGYQVDKLYPDLSDVLIVLLVIWAAVGAGVLSDTIVAWRRSLDG